MATKIMVYLKGTDPRVEVHKRRGKSKVLPVANHPLPVKGDKDSQDSLRVFLELWGVGRPSQSS